MNIKSSSNPIFSKKVMDSFAYSQSTTGTMTVQGTINKIAIMLLIVVLGASFTWGKAMNPATASTVGIWIAVGGIGGFILALITAFRKQSAHITAPIYAVFEGLFLGAISALFEGMFPGLVMKAVLLTFAVMFALLFLYKTGVIKVTQKFRAGVVAATMGIAVAYFVTFILNMFGVNVSFMHGGGTMGMIISLVIVAVAALNLVLDFDFIEQGANSGLPKSFEWYGAFGLMVTLIWLYIEILRLLAIFANRD